MSLFGEIIVNYGADSLPHFALMKAETIGDEADFLLQTAEYHADNVRES